MNTVNCEQTTKRHVSLSNLHSTGSIWTHFKDCLNQRLFQISIHPLLKGKLVFQWSKNCCVSYFPSGPKNGLLLFSVGPLVCWSVIYLFLNTGGNTQAKAQCPQCKWKSSIAIQEPSLDTLRCCWAFSSTWFLPVVMHNALHQSYSDPFLLTHKKKVFYAVHLHHPLQCIEGPVFSLQAHKEKDPGLSSI